MSQTPGLWEKYEVLCAMLHPIGFRPGELQRTPNPEKLFFDAYNLILESDDKTQAFLDTHAALARWYALARTQQAAIDLRDDVGFFNKLAAEVRKITVPDAQASQAAEQAVRQFFSEGLAAGDVLDIFGLADAVLVSEQCLADEADAERLVVAPMQAVFERGIASGHLRQDLPADVLRTLFSGTIMAASKLTQRQQLGLEEASAAAAAVFLDGARAR